MDSSSGASVPAGSTSESRNWLSPSRVTAGFGFDDNEIFFGIGTVSVSPVTSGAKASVSSGSAAPSMKLFATDVPTAFVPFLLLEDVFLDECMRLGLPTLLLDDFFFDESSVVDVSEISYTICPAPFADIDHPGSDVLLDESFWVELIDLLNDLFEPMLFFFEPMLFLFEPMLFDLLFDDELTLDDFFFVESSLVDLPDDELDCDDFFFDESSLDDSSDDKLECDDFFFDESSLADSSGDEPECDDFFFDESSLVDLSEVSSPFSDVLLEESAFLELIDFLLDFFEPMLFDLLFDEELADSLADVLAEALVGGDFLALQHLLYRDHSAVTQQASFFRKPRSGA